MTFPGDKHVREYPDEPQHEHFSQANIDEGAARYRLAGLLAKDKKVLDVACGSGYGPEILMACGASSVTAVDFDKDAIEYCTTHFKNSEVEYGVMDARELTFGRNEFDLVVNHGSLQFNEPPDQERTLAEILRVMIPDGMFMLSMNFNVYYGPDRTKAHPHHIWAFDNTGLEHILRPHFSNFRIAVQHGVLFFMQIIPGTSWIAYGSDDVETFLAMDKVLAPYLRGPYGLMVDMEPVWRKAR